MGVENVGQATVGLVFVLVSAFYIFDRVARYHYMIDIFLAIIVFAAGLIYLYTALEKK